MVNQQQQAQKQKQKQDNALASEVLVSTATRTNPTTTTTTTSATGADAAAVVSNGPKPKNKKKKTKTKKSKRDETTAVMDAEVGRGPLLNRDFKGGATATAATATTDNNNDDDDDDNDNLANQNILSAEQDPFQQPGAFRVFINGLPRSEELAQHSPSEPSASSIPLAEVTPVLHPHPRHTTNEDFYQEEEEEEEPTKTDSKNVEKKQHRGDRFWIIVAAVLGILIVGAVFVTVVMVRSRSKNNNENQQVNWMNTPVCISTVYNMDSTHLNVQELVKHPPQLWK